MAQYPEITPPTIFVTAIYPGANAETVADTVATPLEEQINGVENMFYMSAAMQQRRPDAAVGDVQGRHGSEHRAGAGAEPRGRRLPRLPEEVRALGVTVRKRSPTIAMLVSLVSPIGQVRSGIFEQLRLSACPGRIAPAAGRGGHDHFWRARLFDSRLAGPEQGFGARLDGERHRGGHPPPERGSFGGGVRAGAAAGG